MGVAFGDDGAPMHDHHTVGAIEIIRLGVRKGVIEQSIERAAIDARIERSVGPNLGRPREIRGLRGEGLEFRRLCGGVIHGGEDRAQNLRMGGRRAGSGPLCERESLTVAA